MVGPMCHPVDVARVVIVIALSLLLAVSTQGCNHHSKSKAHLGPPVDATVGPYAIHFAGRYDRARELRLLRSIRARLSAFEAKFGRWRLPPVYVVVYLDRPVPSKALMGTHGALALYDSKKNMIAVPGGYKDHVPHLVQETLHAHGFLTYGEVDKLHVLYDWITAEDQDLWLDSIL